MGRAKHTHKTTLIEVIVGLRQPQFATVDLDGRALRTFAGRAHAFAYLPDTAELPSEVPVRTLIEHALTYRARPAQFVEELRGMLATPPLIDIPSGVLSRGERQRLALFCTLAVDRLVVVLDEPFNAFDPLQLRSVLRAVRRVADEGAIVITTPPRFAGCAPHDWHRLNAKEIDPMNTDTLPAFVCVFTFMTALGCDRPTHGAPAESAMLPQAPPCPPRQRKR